ncbi:MAG TPA: TIM-barrel domain-containing protein, partial [Longimicrobiales bacterium]|nr:TIM-barrel domain-containing protein [Longimicrobiales bacterium]
MTTRDALLRAGVLSILFVAGCAAGTERQPSFASDGAGTILSLPLTQGELRLDGIYFETEQGRTTLPAEITGTSAGQTLEGRFDLPDGRTVTVAVAREGEHFGVRLSASPADDIRGWGFALESAPDEYYTGVMERVVDGPQQASWAPGITEAMNLRGQRIEMLVKPTTSVYAPFFISSRGYGVLLQTFWPGLYDFAAENPARVQIHHDGPELAFKVYVGDSPAEIVQAHAIENGPPVLPPRWAYRPWRWRDEHNHRETYWDGTPVTGPFNSEVMEDVMMLRAFGIPLGVYWIDRPWGPGVIGYDDFDIDPARLPNFEAMVQWLREQDVRTLLWIGPFVKGQMQEEIIARGYGLPGNPPAQQNYPLIDFSNPDAKAYWQTGIEKLINMGVVGFKLDRAEENIPADGPFTRFDGKTIRENRNEYPVLYTQAVGEVTRRMLGDDFIIMPRAAYTGSSSVSVFWGGDVGGVPEGLRASIIAVQRSAVMGYPNWGSDTGGYNQQSMDHDLYMRWLAFSCFTPIMEVGPTRNVGFWNLPREPSYDAEVLAAWRLYARLHDRLADYSYEQGVVAHETGMPIVRPLFLVDPDAPEAWSNWWTYQYGPDLLVSPVWEKDRREQEVYLPSGARWRDAWRPDMVYDGGQTITVPADLHQIPLFVRDGA